jgi:YesN/AraC family two-component response regulator
MYKAYFVDDEPFVLAELAGNPLLTECGFQMVGSSTDPAKAAKEIIVLNPDVVFTDLVMPGCFGIDLMEELQEKGVACEFVIVSAYPQFEESRRFFLLGGFDYILKPISSHNLQQLLIRLAGKLAEKGTDLPIGTPSPELNKIIAGLRENLGQKHTLEALAETHHTTATHICWLFSNYLGTTFVAFITRLRMEEAARLLRETPKDIKEIAILCGYKDYFYFCRVFRKHHLCTPSAFREGVT